MKFIFFLLVVFSGVGCDKGKHVEKPKAEPHSPSLTAEDIESKTEHSKTEHTKEIIPPQLTDKDVKFLVDDCLTDISKEKCACFGEEAKRQLDPTILGKIKNAPKDVEKAKEYYSDAEIVRTMTFLQDATKKCKLDD